ncbi:sensor histidine kinase [Amycolatopsis cihanbeyliensis]|uniref:histidine kinase n=1 Tax=Amycolatopsis cihanbeyliensis TaxID=1128664 RepID=A0A542DK65_AMYCI|nr:sensor histidine kinase [Amycolatopsis cihanbeyliensis]TQJ03491.1 signal transduction histidine kinase [Amycolatopsis cihanbeyliensis]
MRSVLIGLSTSNEPQGARRGLAFDIGLGMLVLVVVGTAITANLEVEGSSPSPAAYAFGALLGSLMLLRRRWPVGTLLVTAAALIVYYMLDYPPVGLAVPVAAALYSAAEQGRLYWAIGTAGALLLISTAVRISEGDDLAYLLGFEFAGSAGLMATVIALGDGVRSRRNWRAELGKQARAAELEREREAARKVEQERLRIARDLHDLLAHTVSIISLHTDVAREALRDDPDTAQRSLVSARTACSDVVRELRATLGALRGTDGAHVPAPGLDRLAELVDTATAAGLRVRVRTTGSPAPLPAISDATAYRVVQEALSNVLRHADARTVHIELDYREDAVVLRIEDDGRGSGQQPDSAGWGIVGMRERLALLGGELRARPRPGGGFLVQARIPEQA